MGEILQFSINKLVHTAYYILYVYYLLQYIYIYYKTIYLLVSETTWLGCRAQMRPLMAPRWVLAYKVLVPALSLKKIPNSKAFREQECSQTCTFFVGGICVIYLAQSLE